MIRKDPQRLRVLRSVNLQSRSRAAPKGQETLLALCFDSAEGCSTGWCPDERLSTTASKKLMIWGAQSRQQAA